QRLRPPRARGPDAGRVRGRPVAGGYLHAVAVVRHRQPAARHRGAVAAGPQRARAVPDLRRSVHPRGRASRRTADADLPGVAGAWVMSGCCVGGLSVSPALGEAMAGWIVDGAPALDCADIAPARFAGAIDEADLRERCRHAYATHYRASGGDAAP